MDGDASGPLQAVQNYRKLVLLYEAIDSQIDALIMAHNGVPERMNADERAQYRALARQRDEVLNEMRLLEQQLMEQDQNDESA